MKVLYVHGSDFSAVDFERSNYTVKEIYELCLENNGIYAIDDEENNFYADFQAFEFGDVDPEFIRFIRHDIQDYDISKAHNFFVLEEG